MSLPIVGKTWKSQLEKANSIQVETIRKITALFFSPTKGGPGAQTLRENRQETQEKIDGLKSQLIELNGKLAATYLFSPSADVLDRIQERERQMEKLQAEIGDLANQAQKGSETAEALIQEQNELVAHSSNDAEVQQKLFEKEGQNAGELSEIRSQQAACRLRQEILETELASLLSIAIAKLVEEQKDNGIERTLTSDEAQRLGAEEKRNLSDLDVLRSEKSLAETPVAADRSQSRWDERYQENQEESKAIAKDIASNSASAQKIDSALSFQQGALSQLLAKRDSLKSEIIQKKKKELALGKTLNRKIMANQKKIGRIYDKKQELSLRRSDILSEKEAIRAAQSDLKAKQDQLDKEKRDLADSRAEKQKLATAPASEPGDFKKMTKELSSLDLQEKNLARRALKIENGQKQEERKREKNGRAYEKLSQKETDGDHAFARLQAEQEILLSTLVYLPRRTSRFDRPPGVKP